MNPVSSLLRPQEPVMQPLERVRCLPLSWLKRSVAALNQMLLTSHGRLKRSGWIRCI